MSGGRREREREVTIDNSDVGPARIQIVYLFFCRMAKGGGTHLHFASHSHPTPLLGQAPFGTNIQVSTFPIPQIPRTDQPTLTFFGTHAHAAITTAARLMYVCMCIQAECFCPNMDIHTTLTDRTRTMRHLSNPPAKELTALHTQFSNHVVENHASRNSSDSRG